MIRALSRISRIARFSELAKFNDSFNVGTSAEYIENLFDKWHQNPTSVPATWDAYFQQVVKLNQFDFTPQPTGLQGIQFDAQGGLRKSLSDHFRVRLMINQYRMRGHEKAKIDPLELDPLQQVGKITGQSKIDVHEYFSEQDLDREFYIFDQVSNGITSDKKRQIWKLRDLVAYLEKAYCGKISYEYMHIQNKEERDWMRFQIENYDEFMPSKEQKLLTFERLCKEYVFSTFLQRKFNTSKRFGIEGLDSMISGLQQLVEIAAKSGVEHLVFGMAHRGRLNTLYNVFQKSAEEMMMEFQDLKSQEIDEEVWGQSGDVKYHLGATHHVKVDNKEIRLEMLPNPSHLETVDPLVYGKVKAIQDYIRDLNHDKAFGVLIHGDAAMSGQGVVYESLQMAELEGYSSGGIMHIVANNQIGFTTVPIDGRSGLYCTDIAHTIQAPVIHVNADEPELVDKVLKIATEFRNKFKKDIFVDIVGYRRYGHNEQDQPKFTQPIMYEKIDKAKPVFLKYAEKLIAQGVLTQEKLDQSLKQHEADLEIAYNKSRNKDVKQKDIEPAKWEKFLVPKQWGRIKDTGVPVDVLKNIGEKINTIPQNVNSHPQIRKFYEERLASIKNDSGIDFATAEALAFGSLLYEGYNVRVSGEDVQRATFSHRHAFINDQKDPNGDPYVPLRTLVPDAPHRVNFFNSHLSEYGVLGFDYGYSLSNPNTLVCWEAQFGDFANGCQIIIDNYIASAESKWNVDSGIVLLLPNGMDGQGPEHSSGRVERFLQLSDDDPNVMDNIAGVRLKRQIRNSNMQIVQCTTPANYFHALRRQLRRDFRKPLIAMTSKKLLRYAPSRSPLAAFSEQGRFNQIYDDVLQTKPENVKTVLLCSGQVYYDLLKAREDKKRNDVAIVRIEQLAPFPYEFLQNVIVKYQNSKFLWVQEEHQNYGPWYFVKSRINKVFDKTPGLEKNRITYVGRKPSGSTATGFHQLHDQQLHTFLQKAFE